MTCHFSLITRKINILEQFSLVICLSGRHQVNGEWRLRLRLVVWNGLGLIATSQAVVSYSVSAISAESIAIPGPVSSDPANRPRQAEMGHVLYN